MPNSESRRPIAFDAYEALARPFADRAQTNAWNALYDRPNTLSLLPDVKGKNVLDAGCGPGWYSSWLVEHGAEVTAIDVCPTMIDLARERLGGRVRVERADLDEPLTAIESGAFDIVLSALVIEYIRDWRAAFREFARVLRSGGLFVLSCPHPFADHLRHPETDYYETSLVEDRWNPKRFGVQVTVPSYLRPLSELVNSLVDAGFVIDRMLEPRPSPDMKQHSPELWEHISTLPHFLWLRAHKA